MLAGSSVTGDALNRTNIRLAVDFTTRRSNALYNKYVGVAKARFKNGSAVSAAIGSGSGNNRWLDVISGSPYFNGRTFFSPQNAGIGATDPVGIMYVTYYVWFKTQRVDT